MTRAPAREHTGRPLVAALGLMFGPAVSLGLGRFAYALVLPPMRSALHWSYATAGAMNTANALGYLARCFHLDDRAFEQGINQRPGLDNPWFDHFCEHQPVDVLSRPFVEGLIALQTTEPPPRDVLSQNLHELLFRQILQRDTAHRQRLWT